MASTFSTYTKEELLKKLKNQKLFLLIQSVVIILMLIFGVFSTVENGMSFHTFLPLFFIPMLFVMVYELKKIKKELTSRT
jgi:membrane-associated HD superfamily phosphohydrolase